MRIFTFAQNFFCAFSTDVVLPSTSMLWCPLPHLLLEGKADRYEQFLSSSGKINLVDISDDFHFRIQTLEGPTILLRHVSTHGQVISHGELSDAFFALMLSYRPGGFSSSAPLGVSGPYPDTPTLHWHLANRSCVNHHCNSKVTYLRLESAALLRRLAAQAIAVSQLESLQGFAAPASLVQLIESMDQQLSSAEPQQHGSISEGFLIRLAEELRQLLGQPRPSDANAAGHASMAIEIMMSQLDAPVSLQQLAHEVALTTRSVQACFKSQLGLSPMRWLKLARISQLQQLLWHPDLANRSLPQLMARCGLTDTSLNRRCFREVYGISPMEQRRHARSVQQRYKIVMQDSLHHQFKSFKSAIRYLESLKPNERNGANIRIAITISTISLDTNDKTDKLQRLSRIFD
jgi:AraC-like DNA-binding protein